MKEVFVDSFSLTQIFIKTYELIIYTKDKNHKSVDKYAETVQKSCFNKKNKMRKYYKTFLLKELVLYNKVVLYSLFK